MEKNFKLKVQKKKNRILKNGKKKEIKPIILLVIISIGTFLSVISTDVQSGLNNKNLIENKIINPNKYQTEIDRATPKVSESYYFGEHSSYTPYGEFVSAPKYARRIIGDPNDRLIFQAINFQGYFIYEWQQNEILVNGTKTYNGYGDYIEFNIMDYLNQTASYNITARFYDDVSKKWIQGTTWLDVVNYSISMDPYYDNFTTTISSISSINYRISVNYGTNWQGQGSLYLNGTSIQNLTIYDSSYDKTLYFSYYFNQIGIYNFEMNYTDSMGNSLYDNFTVKVVPANAPYIEKFDIINDFCYDNGNYNYRLWEMPPIKLEIYAGDHDFDLDRIILGIIDEKGYFRNIKTINNASSGEQYIVEMGSIQISEIISKYYPQIQSEGEITFALIAIDKNGLSSYNQDQGNYISELRIWIDNYNLYFSSQFQKLNLTKGRNVMVLSVSEPNHEDITYRITIVVDTLEATTLIASAVTGKTYTQDWNSFKPHCRVYNDGPCDLFEGKDYDHEWLQMGVVFWINVENISAIQNEIIIKVDYPEWIEPNTDLGDAPLSMLHYNACYTFRDEYGRESNWEKYSNDTMTKVGITAYEFRTNRLGLFAFGQDSLDYYDIDKNDSGMNIPGYNLSYLLMATISTIFSILYIYLKRRKKLKL